MKIVITARNFAAGDKAALNLLLAAGHEVLDYSDRGCGTGTAEEEMAALIGNAEAVNFQAMNLQAAQNVLDFVNGTIQPQMQLV